jgi:MFS family permease
MSATAEPLVSPRGSGATWLWRRQLDAYPETRARVLYLAITVLATVMLYYELYVGGSVSTLILTNLHMSFTFFVTATAFGNLIGAFGSLFAGITDRLGRANMVVFGLLFTGIVVGFVLPLARNEWTFIIEGFVVGVVEGICLVATPALIRDFSPQVGRATAMGFWTAGPVLGSLIVSVVGSITVPAIVHSSRFWTHEYRICGIAGIVVFVVALVALRELSPQLRDQLMVTLRDRALIEMKAKGLDVAAALRHPFRQLLKADVVVSAFAVSVMLLIYYTAVGFAVIYFAEIFGFSVKDGNGLGNWNWGFNVIAVILVGLLSDRFKVRKPFMVIGGVLAAIMTVIYLLQAGLHPGYYSLAIILALLSLGLGIAYTPWMASFTETVEDRNPALTATGLAIWGWIIRIVVFVAFLIIPHVITSVTPLLEYGGTATADLAKYGTQLTFAQTHGSVIADAQKYKTEFAFASANPTVVATATKFAPELTVISANPALFAKLATYSNPAKIPPKLVAQAVKAAGGGVKGLGILSTISANGKAIAGLKPYSAQLAALAKVPKPVVAAVSSNATELAALAKVPPSVFTFFKVHGATVSTAASESDRQWKTWYWICFGGIIFFLLSIPLLRGRWSTAAARKDEDEHEAKVAAELAAMQA